MSTSIASIRKDYSHAELDIYSIAHNPIEQFQKWLNEAINAKVNEPTAMNLATISPENKPSSRIVLLKEVNESGFVFYTNYESEKGYHIQYSPYVALTFFWAELERHVRIEGVATKVSTEESDLYFNSRPLGSKIGAWSSPQSKVISGRDVLERNVEKYSLQFKEEVKRPEHWGGYSVEPEKIEFWQGRPSRLHDRIVFKKTDGNWKIERLAP